MAALMTALTIAGLVLAVAWRCRPRHGRDPAQPTRRVPTVLSEPSGVVAFLEVAAREVRTGSSVGVAVAEAMKRAGDDSDALRSALAAQATDVHADVALAAQAARRASSVGQHPAAVFDRAAATLRERAACRDEQRAHTAQARLSARVLTVVPVAFAVFTVTTNPSVRQVYLGSPVGALVVVAGAALNVIGWWWMRRIVERAAT